MIATGSQSQPTGHAMIELAFVACLSAAPLTCEPQSLLYTDISPMTCALRAQPALAHWVETHPAYRIARWRCRLLDGSREI